MAEYPHGLIKATAILHALLGGAVIGVNVHAFRKTTNIFDLPLVGVPDLIRGSMMLIFIPFFVVGAYIIIMAAVGEGASSRRTKPSTVNNYKIFYLVLNILSAFSYTLGAGVGNYLVYMSLAYHLDPFGIGSHLKANFGLLGVELLLSLFCMLICCVSHHPGENVPTPTPQAVPTVNVQMPNQLYNPPAVTYPYVTKS